MLYVNYTSIKKGNISDNGTKMISEVPPETDRQTEDITYRDTLA